MKPFYYILVMLMLFSAASAHGAALGVSPTNINRQAWNLTAWSDQSVVSNQVAIRNTNGIDAMVFTNTVSYGDANTNWLTVTPATGTSYGEEQIAWVQMVATGLPPRTNAYEGSIQVDAGSATSSPQVVQVTLLVQGVNLWISPTNFSKTMTEGQGPVWETGFQLANTGAEPRGTISYTLNSLAGWLATSPTNGVVQYNTNQVSLGYVIAGWPAGTYASQVEVVAPGLGTQAVNVDLRINQRPVAAWNADSKVWTNEALAGGAVATTTIEVWNASAEPIGTMNYQVSVNSTPLGWVTVNSASGVSTGNHGVVTVSYNTAGLAAGIYTGQLTLTGVDQATGQAATNSPLTVGLKLTIKGTPALKTDPASLSQTVLENSTGTSSLFIWNGGGLPRGGMRYAVTADVNWVSMSPAAGVVTNATNAVLVTWGGGSLAPGTNWGTLRVDAYDAQTETPATDSPALIPLKLIVTPRTPLNLELPAVVGILYVGQTVSNYPGLWQNQGRLSFGYQWQRAVNNYGGGCEILSGEVGSTHLITTADRGKYLSIVVTATDPTPYPLRSSATSTWVKVKALTADFNGDGITDLWFYDESTGTWRANFGTYDSAAGVFGGPNMTAVPGDYDGDGNEDLGVFDRSNGIWHMLYLPRGAYVQGSLFGGTSMEAMAAPVPADYDGDGATDVALYWLGYWAVRYSSTWVVNVVEPFAEMYGMPVVADWDGDGIAEMAVYENGVWSIRHGNGTVTTATFGGGDAVLPAVADYDGDSVADLGVYDVSINQWRIWLSQTATATNITFASGGTVAFPGYYDHDPLADWGQARLAPDNDFIIWEIKRTAEPIINPLYPTNWHGQSFQQTTGRWRVSW